MVIAAAATSSSVDRNHTLLPWCNINTEQETGPVLGSENQITSRKKKSKKWRPQVGRYWAGQVLSFKASWFQLCVITHRPSFFSFISHTLSWPFRITPPTHSVWRKDLPFKPVGFFTQVKEINTWLWYRASLLLFFVLSGLSILFVLRYLVWKSCISGTVTAQLC